MSTQKSEQPPIEKIKDTAHQATRAESEPAPVRRYRARLFRWTLVLTAIAFILVTFLVKTISSFSVDLQIAKTIQLIHFPPFSVLMNVVSWPGVWPQSTIITGLVILLIYGFSLHWEAVMALVAAVSSTAVDLLVKDLIRRPRPATASAYVIAILGYSFPSGHVVFYVGFLGFIGFLAFTLLKPSPKRTVLLVFLSGPIILIGASRIYLGQHWASDVLGAYLLGSLILAVLVQVYIWGKTRFFVHQPVAAAAGPQKT